MSNRRNGITAAAAITLLLMGFGLLPPAAPANDDAKPTRASLPAELVPGLKHLLGVVDPGTSEGFDLETIEPVLNFVTSSKETANTIHQAKAGAFEAPLSYHEIKAAVGLQRILQTVYHPEIPPEVFTPASLRLSYWKQAPRLGGAHPFFGRLLKQAADAPIIVRGIEHEEITPDTYTGTYYNYDLYRTMILCYYRGQPLFISLSMQVDTSSTGRKGYTIGSDSDWNYLYSGQEGLTINGLGWVDAHMYDSASIMLYYPDAPESAAVRCGVFKWLRAGWLEINMVNSGHIHNGLLRWAKAFRNTLESSRGQPVGELAAAFGRIRSLSRSQLRRRIAPYADMLARRIRSDPELPENLYEEVIGEQDYFNRLTNRQMRAILNLEYMKALLGKPHSVTDPAAE